eukprot:gene25135-31554_t
MGPTVAPSTSLQPTPRPSFNLNPLSEAITIAGTGVASSTGDNGPASLATLNSVRSVRSDVSGNLFLSDSDGNRIRIVDANQIIVALIASGRSLAGPRQTVGDTNSHYLYVADCYASAVQSISLTTGLTTTVAGQNTLSAAFGDGGPATSAAAKNPDGLWLDSLGNLYFSDVTASSIRKPSHYATPLSQISTVVGTGAASSAGDGGPVSSVSVNAPRSVWADSQGNLYVAEFVGRFIGGALGLWLDTTNNVYIAQYDNHIRRVDGVSLVISTVAGSGDISTVSSAANGDDGPATSASFQRLWQLFGDTNHALFVSDVKNLKVRRVDLVSGIVSLFAGTGATGVSSNLEGPATSTGMNGPRGVWADSLGRMYLTETDGNKIKRVDADSGWCRTIAGSEGWPTFAPSRVPTLTIQPSHYATPLSQISTVVGTGAASSAGDG